RADSPPASDPQSVIAARPVPRPPPTKATPPPMAPERSPSASQSFLFCPASSVTPPNSPPPRHHPVTLPRGRGGARRFALTLVFRSRGGVGSGVLCSTAARCDVG